MSTLDTFKKSPIPFKGRGSSVNPANRFEQIFLEPDPEAEEFLTVSPKTQFFKDTAQSIITYNDSPDIGFRAGINPYRGCEHGCIYCYARPNHEYLGFSAGLDFETKIFVKLDAPRLLKKELSSPRWEPQVIALSGVTDCYQPAERRFQITRQCLEVLAEFRNPVGIVTKNRLITRDIDVLKRLAQVNGVCVFISMTTLDAKLCGVMEPRTSRPEERLKAIEQLHREGIPVGVLVAPVIPALTDHEMPKIIEQAVKAGAQFAGYTIVRLPFGVKFLFEDWLENHFPDKKEKVLNRIKSMRGGKLNDPHFGSRMSGQGIFAEQIEGLFHMACKKNGLPKMDLELSTWHFERPGEKQLALF